LKCGPATGVAANDTGCVQAFTSLPLSFLRIVGLVLYWIKSKLAATPRARARVWSEQQYEYGKEVPHPDYPRFTAALQKGHLQEPDIEKLLQNLQTVIVSGRIRADQSIVSKYIYSPALRIKEFGLI